MPHSIFPEQCRLYKHGGPCQGRLFWRKIVPYTGIMNSTDKQEEKSNFSIQGRCIRRSFKNYCNYWYFIKLSWLLSIIKLGIDVLLSEHILYNHHASIVRNIVTPLISSVCPFKSCYISYINFSISFMLLAVCLRFMESWSYVLFTIWNRLIILIVSLVEETKPQCQSVNQLISQSVSLFVNQTPTDSRSFRPKKKKQIDQSMNSETISK